MQAGASRGAGRRWELGGCAFWQSPSEDDLVGEVAAQLLVWQNNRGQDEHSAGIRTQPPRMVMAGSSFPSLKRLSLSHCQLVWGLGGLPWGRRVVFWPHSGQETVVVRTGWAEGTEPR